MDVLRVTLHLEAAPEEDETVVRVALEAEETENLDQSRRPNTKRLATLATEKTLLDLDVSVYSILDVGPPKTNSDESLSDTANWRNANLSMTKNGMNQEDLDSSLTKTSKTLLMPKKMHPASTSTDTKFELTIR